MSREALTPGGEIVLYHSPDGEVRLDVRLEQETVWLSLNQMADLFGRDKSVISRHLRNVFVSRELEREATVAKIATVQREGEREIVREIEALALLVAESEPTQKELMIRLILNLLENGGQ